jgi:RNA polymerase sigma factor (sigma-70 family)
LRNRRRRVALLEQFAEDLAANAESANPAMPADRQHRWLLLQRAMASLKPRHQTIIALHFTEGLKLEEVSSVLGGSPSTVRSQLSRALAKLRQKLKHGSETDFFEPRS